MQFKTTQISNNTNKDPHNYSFSRIKNHFFSNLKYLFLIIIVSFFTPLFSDAQSISNQTYIYNGFDTDPSVLTISSSSIYVNQGQPIQSLKLVNAAGSLISTDCSAAFNFDVTVDGITIVSNGCANDINNLSIPTSFSTITITSFDNNSISDPVTIKIDLQVTYQTPACPAVSNISALNITSNSADIDFQNNNTSLPAGWQCQYGLAGFTLGTGTTVSTTFFPSFSLSSLSANTFYDVYVRVNCGAGSNSVWAGPYTFQTLCNGYSIPYTEGFESGYTNQSDIAGCLTQASISGTNSWKANSTMTTYNRAPRTGSFDATLANSNEDYFFIPVNLTGGTSYRFICYARQDGITPANANITVKYGTVSNQYGMTNTIAATTSLDSSYKKIQADFTPTSTGKFYIGVKGNINNLAQYITLDDISITLSPSCIEPSALNLGSVTTSTANITWSAPPSGIPTGGYSWVTVNSGGSPTATAIASGTVTANAAAISGLAPNTAYSFYVKSNCSASTSLWTGPLNFKTACGIATIPYLENFDTYTNGLPDCWQQENTNSDGIMWGISSTASCTGKGLSIAGSTTTSMNDWAFSPIFTMTAGNTYRLMFSYSNNSSTNAENLKLYIGSAQNSTSCLAGTLLFQDSNFSYNSVCKNVVLEYTPSVSGNYSFGWNGFSNANNSTIYLDNVSLNLAPTSSAIIVASNSNNNQCTPYALNGVAGKDWHYLLDASGNTVLAINPNGNKLGNISIKMTDNSSVSATNNLNSSNSHKLMPRYFSITPANQPTSNVDVRLYFQGSELDAMNSSSLGQGSSNLTRTNLQVNKYTVVTPDCDYSNNPTSAISISQVSAAVGNSTGTSDFYLQFPVSSFSEFVVSEPLNFTNLPLKISSFIGKLNDRKILLSWTVSSITEPENIFVQKLINDVWMTIGIVPVNHDGDFNFIDDNLNEMNMYRLMFNDKFTVTLGIKASNTESIGIFPNPSSGSVFVDLSSVTLDGYQVVIYDMVGRKVKQENLNSNTINKINVSEIPKGSFLIKVINNGSVSLIQKLVIQ